MNDPKFIAVVGMGAILPDATDVDTFWQNVLAKKVSIVDVPSDRWNEELYYDPDRSAVDKTYSKIGGFVRGFQFDPLKNGIAIPPKVLAVMDQSQQWAIAASQQALRQYGYPARPLDPERVAVIFGNALAGEGHYRSTFRILVPEYLEAMKSSPEFKQLPENIRESLIKSVTDQIRSQIPVITEDTMPGELGNIIAGRVANVFNFSGPNYITDAACASSLAALQGAVDGLIGHKFDAVLTGGIDRNMGPESFIKFSKIGALSADGSRPYADGANGFVMGEGAVVFLLKRLEDAERDGDKIFAVMRGIGGSSDGKGKGITAPNPLGQQRALERAWRDSGINPDSVGLIEGHGTSTKVGDLTEVNSLNTIFGSLGLQKSSVVLGSVKSNLGHLKSAAGAVGLLKVILALHHRVLPPTASFHKPNPNIDFANLPFRVISEAQEWETKNGNHRFAGVSSFGFGGTNFHVVLEEYFPGMAGNAEQNYALPKTAPASISAPVSTPAAAPMATATSTQSADTEKIKEYVLATVAEKTGYPVEMLDMDLDLEADLGVDTVKQAELFATIRTHYGIPRREDLRLSDYNTLAKVVGFMQDALNAGTVQPETSIPAASVVVSVPTTSVDSEAIKQYVLSTVAEKTGYPVEMLDLELDLEADLGIDTVKQAELFATIRGNYGIPRREDLRLSEYNTLAKVMGFVQDALNAGMGQVSTSPAPASTQPAVEAPSTNSADTDAIKAYVLATVAEKTGYPVEMLDLDLDLEADLGVDTVKQAELFATIRTHYNIPRREDLRLSEYNTLAKVVGFMQDALNSGSGLTVADPKVVETVPAAAKPAVNSTELKPYQGLFFASANHASELKQLVQNQLNASRSGAAHVSSCPTAEDLAKSERIAVSYASPEELLKRLEKAASAFGNENAATWKALQAHSIFRGSGKPGKVAFLFPGQGSQYVNMLLDLRDIEPVVRETFAEADRAMTPILGRPLTSYIYTNGSEEELKQAEQELKKTAITQPAMLTANVAVMRVMQKFGVQPDMVIGHSLGEYAALVAAGVLTFSEALEVVSARGREMTKIKVDDPGCMAAVSAPLEKVEEVIKSIDAYVVIANINSPVQCVLGGSSTAIDAAIAKFTADGFQAVKIPVSHAFHTKIVAPASIPLREVIARMNVSKPQLPIVANVTGDLYPTERDEILDILASQVASPVQFVKGMQTLYQQGARVFIECGPKRVLNALAVDNLKDREDVTIIATNHPRKGGLASFNEALCAIYAAGISSSDTQQAAHEQAVVASSDLPVKHAYANGISGSVVITGAGLGLPGREHHVFEDANVESILNGNMRIEALTEEARQSMLDKHVTRLVKSDAGAVMEEIHDIEKTLKLSGQSGAFDLVEEFGVPEERAEALDRSSQLAIAAGIEALRDAGIPLVMSYRRTTKGTFLPDRWKLPEAMQEETGVIFGSAFPGMNRMAEEADRFYASKMLEQQLKELQAVIDLVSASGMNEQNPVLPGLLQRKAELETQIKDAHYQFDRRFVFRVLSMGHSQFAEYIGARGPNTHVNAACATTTHAISIAEDWIRSGRCRRVIVIAGDDVTNNNLIQWIGTSMFASGAATTEEDVRLAAVPFDRRRNGMIMGMGAAALVIESEDAARERGVRAIGEILATHTANSAFHGTRLDVQHVSEVMERLLQTAENRFGIRRNEIAGQTVFMSHETYTPARGGSAAAEIRALRECFKESANQVIIANTKGFTGHSMAVGIEDVVVVKALETGKVPPIAHIHDGFEPDPDLGDLNLSRGGIYNPQYALRLGAGFGSQIAMTLVHKIPGVGERIDQQRYQQWLASVSGYSQAELEVDRRTLRIKNQGVPTREPARSIWQYGEPPAAWACGEIITLPAYEPALPVLPAEQPAPRLEAATPTVVESIPSDPETEAIKAHVLSVISEKTGYPSEMLDMELDLEADLGVDTVKQAEFFAAVRTHYGIPRREDLRLSDYNTLAKVVSFVQDALKARAAERSAEQSAPAENMEATANSVEKTSTENDQLSHITRRVPVPVLFPKTELCLPTEVALENATVLIVSDIGKTAAALAKKLQARGAETIVVKPAEAAAKAEEMANRLNGVYYLPALDADPDWKTADVQTLAAARSVLIETLYQIARVLPASAFLISATRMGGLHGLQNAKNPLGGLVSGFTKALRQERGQFTKVVDFQPLTAPAKIADAMLAETLHDPISIEIGYEDGLRFSLILQEVSSNNAQASALKEGGVYVVSGGTGGITGTVMLDLAKATRGSFYLLGRTHLPAKDDADLQLLKTNRAALMSELKQRAADAGEKATPVQLEQKVAAFERAAATLDVINAVEAAGGKAAYLVCDVTDPQSVAAAVEQISKAEKQVNVFIHAAGMEKSRKIESKSLEEFQQIISVKANGFLNVFKSLEQNNRLPGAVVFFSSVAGRFGNSGQTDYSAANDLLSKYALWLPSQYPGMQAISIDWGAWAEVGMASRGSIPMLMERAGIEMLKPAAAAPMVRAELELGFSGEVVIAGSLGALEQGAGDPCLVDIALADGALRSKDADHTMFSHLTGFSAKAGVRLEAELDPTVLSFLRDHAINGTPVLPGVVGIEGFSVAARHIASALASNNGGFAIEKLEDICFLAPFKFYGSKPRSITWKAVAYRQAAGLEIDVMLESEVKRHNGCTEQMLHFTGRVYLTTDQPAVEALQNPPKWSKKQSVSSDDIYKLYFHGPSFQVLDSAQMSGGMVLGKFNKKLVNVPADEPRLMATPLLIELCFQTAGLYELGATGILALPRSIGTLKIYEQPLNGVPIYAEVRPHEVDGRYTFDARVFDSKGNVYLELSNYCTSPLPYPAEKDLVEPFKVLVPPSVGSND